eukprot:1091343-Amphidinium_carterae.1
MGSAPGPGKAGPGVAPEVVQRPQPKHKRSNKPGPLLQEWPRSRSSRQTKQKELASMQQARARSLGKARLRARRRCPGYARLRPRMGLSCWRSQDPPELGWVRSTSATSRHEVRPVPAKASGLRGGTSGSGTTGCPHQRRETCLVSSSTVTGPFLSRGPLQWTGGRCCPDTAPSSRSGRSNVPKTSKQEQGLVRPPLTHFHSHSRRKRKKRRTKRLREMELTGVGKRRHKEFWRGRTPCGAEQRWLLTWEGQAVEGTTSCEKEKSADSGKPLLKVFFSPLLHFCSRIPPWRGRVAKDSLWVPEIVRIGEAKNPGPPTLDRPSGGQNHARSNIKILTVNAGGWAPVLDSLALQLYDVILVQETWLMEGSIRSASFQASQKGYEGVFAPARKDKTLGRGKGGLAILSRLGTPMLRAVSGTQADLGRWLHALIQVRPDECLHIINLYGWVDDEFATRQMIMEVAGQAAELPGQYVLVGGDWNLEPNEFPIDLVQGAGLHRPLARPGATAPQSDRRLDWFLVSTGLLPNSGWEELTAYKPDHTAVAIELAVQFQAPKYQGIQKNPEANEDQAHLRFWIDPASWQAALERQDVEELWELWNTAAVAALERTKKASRKGQAVLAHAWPARLGECPPTAAAQKDLLEGRISSRKTLKAKESRKAWQRFVKEAWEESPKKIFKWLKGKTLVWNLAVSLDGRWAAGPAEVAELEVHAWNKLWQGEPVTQDRPRTVPNNVRALVEGGPKAEGILALLKRAGKRALGADRWAYHEVLALVRPGEHMEALDRLAEFYQIVETQGFWPESFRDLLLLQLPKAGAVNAGERRPIALMPVIYRIWASSCKPRLLSWRGQRSALGHTPVGRGALDEAFDLSLEVEELSGQLRCACCWGLLRLFQVLRTSLLEWPGVGG